MVPNENIAVKKFIDIGSQTDQESESAKKRSCVDESKEEKFDGADTCTDKLRIDTAKLKYITDMFSKSASKMAIALAKEIEGEDALAKMSPTGKGNWEAIPSDTYLNVRGEQKI